MKIYSRLRKESENYNVACVLVLLSLLTFSVSCGSSQASRDAQHTTTIDVKYVTQTREFPTITRTKRSTPTPTPTPTRTLTQTSIAPTPTLMPLFPGDVTPLKAVYGSIVAETYPNDDHTDILLHISRGEEFVQEISLSYMRLGNDEYFWPTHLGGVNRIIFSDFQLDGDPEIILDIYTPGANCCTLVIILYFDGSSSQYRNTHGLVNKYTLSPVLTDINEDGVNEIVRRDEDLYYELWGPTSASSISPIQIYTFSEDKLINVSFQFPEIIESDAEDLLQELQSYEFCATWAWVGYLAEMHTLGMVEEGWRQYRDTCEHLSEEMIDAIENALIKYGYIE